MSIYVKHSPHFITVSKTWNWNVAAAGSFLSNFDWDRKIFFLLTLKKSMHVKFDVPERSRVNKKLLKSKLHRLFKYLNSYGDRNICSLRRSGGFQDDSPQSYSNSMSQVNHYWFKAVQGPGARDLDVSKRVPHKSVILILVFPYLPLAAFRTAVHPTNQRILAQSARLYTFPGLDVCIRDQRLSLLLSLSLFSLSLSISPRETRRNFPQEFRVGDLCQRAAAFVPRRHEHCAHNFNIAAV